MLGNWQHSTEAVIGIIVLAFLMSFDCILSHDVIDGSCDSLVEINPVALALGSWRLLVLKLLVTCGLGVYAFKRRRIGVIRLAVGCMAVLIAWLIICRMLL